MASSVHLPSAGIQRDSSAPVAIDILASRIFRSGVISAFALGGAGVDEPRPLVRHLHTGLEIAILEDAIK